MHYTGLFSIRQDSVDYSLWYYYLANNRTVNVTCNRASKSFNNLPLDLFCFLSQDGLYLGSGAVCLPQWDMGCGSWEFQDL